MDKSTYLTGVGGAYDQGFADGTAVATKQNYGGAYAVGYDGYYLPQSLRDAAIGAASLGWDDGAAGNPKTYPAYPDTFSAGNVLVDLQQTYDFAYDLGKSNAGTGASTTSYTGWIVAAAAAAVLVGAGVLYTMRKPADSPQLAVSNPTKIKRVKCPECGSTMVPATGGSNVYACMACWKAGLDDIYYEKKGKKLTLTSDPKLLTA